MPDFPHLEFLQAYPGTYKYTRGGGRNVNERTELNLLRMPDHGRELKDQIERVSQDWLAYLAQQNGGDATQSAAARYIPFYLQIDPNALDEDTLRGWGIDVVAVEQGGYIIGVATSADYAKLRIKLDTMIGGSMDKVKGVAGLWDIAPRGQSLDRIVESHLMSRWDIVRDEAECWVEVSVSVDTPRPTRPQNPTMAQENRWVRKSHEWEEKRDQCVAELERLVRKYEGEEIAQIDQDDTVTYKLKVSGRCLHEIAYVPHVFEIIEYDPGVEQLEREATTFENVQVTVIPPTVDAPKVCIIDSGIQARHILLEPAIDTANARSYVPGETAVADFVSNGGHGTRVAGAVLYPFAVPSGSVTVQPIAWLQNARVLDRANVMHKRLFPPTLMRRIVSDFAGTRIFNLSIQSRKPCLTTHMSAWAAEIDRLSNERDVLFITSAGNIVSDDPLSFRLGIKQHLANGRNYPLYLGEDSCRIGNPAQSCQAITVGSVCFDRIATATHTSFGERDMPSSFSRTGLGMWNMIKPDVVEYGGDFVQTATGDFVFLPESSPELVTSTMYGLPPVSRTTIGTSYSAPKVTHIAAALAAAFPNHSTLLYRALIIQSAQWPAALEHDSPSAKLFHLRTLGYGIPDKSRALENSDERITFIEEGALAAHGAHIYQVRLDSLNGLEDDTLYRIEVTLSYAARPRRTRQTMHKYVSTRLKWQMADLGQSLPSFLHTVDVTLQPGIEVEADASGTGMGADRVQWQIGSSTNSGNSAQTVNRQGGTLQKDWAVVEGFKLSRDRLLFAVTGHEGWDKKSGEEVPYAFAVTITSLVGLPIYEQISIANRIRVEV